MSNREKYFINKGFTLIEMMVVVAIVAILVAVGIPQYKKYMLNAKTTEAVTAMKQIADAMRAYYDTHGQFPADMYATIVREEYGVSNGIGCGGHNYRAISNDLPTLDISSSTNWSYGVSAQVHGGQAVFRIDAQVCWPSDEAGFFRTVFYLSDLDACGVTSANKVLFDGNIYKGELYASSEETRVAANATLVNIAYSCYGASPGM